MADETKIQVRLPAALHQRLTAASERDHRSLNGEIVAACMLGLDIQDELHAYAERQRHSPLGEQVEGIIARHNAKRRQKRTQPA